MNSILIFVASVVRQKKVKAYGVIQANGTLVVTGVDIISNSSGRFDESELIEEAETLQEKGFIVQIEDTKAGSIAARIGTILLQDRERDGRSKRDVRFDQYLRLKNSGKLFIDKTVRVHEPGLSEYRIETDPSSGKAKYLFENEFEGDFRAILMMCGLVFGQPFDNVFLSKMMAGLDVDPVLSQREKVISKITRGEGNANLESVKKIKSMSDQYSMEQLIEANLI